jgi:hypothetical protein
MSEIFVNLTCINWTPVYYEHESWSQGGKVKNGFTKKSYFRRWQIDCAVASMSSLVAVSSSLIVFNGDIFMLQLNITEHAEKIINNYWFSNDSC